jgi:hypothetical protein
VFDRRFTSISNWPCRGGGDGTFDLGSRFVCCGLRMRRKREKRNGRGEVQVNGSLLDPLSNSLSTRHGFFWGGRDRRVARAAVILGRPCPHHCGQSIRMSSACFLNCDSNGQEKNSDLFEVNCEGNLRDDLLQGRRSLMTANRSARISGGVRADPCTIEARAPRPRAKGNLELAKLVDKE